MKKTYKAPNYKTIDLSGETMIAQSIDGLQSTLGDGEGEGEYAKVYVTKQGGSLWDDEW